MTDTTAFQRPEKAVDHKVHRLRRRFGLLVWAPVIFVLCGAFAAWHFVSFAFSSNPFLNGVILMVACWGCYTMVGHVRHVYLEDRVFHAGMTWVRHGAWGDEPDPELGPKAYVRGMLGRLHKLGLGHQVYVQSAAMEPELDALHEFFEKRQELSQFIVGLMVGLGLLGTFIGLLETLVATSTLIGTIANSFGSGSANMESEFANIVGGLRKPLSAMGTAFSASMFGLIGSIMLGFQMIIVRRTVAAFVEIAREEVLSIAEKTKTNTEVEITERFLATLLADILEQHKETVTKLNDVSNKLHELIPKVEATSLSSQTLSERVQSHEEVLARTTEAVGSVRDVIPVMSELAQASSGVFKESRHTSDQVGKMLSFLPEQTRMLQQVDTALQHVTALTREVEEIKASTKDMLGEVREHTNAARRLDALLVSADKAAMRQILESDQ